MGAGQFMTFFFALAGLFAPLRSLTKVNMEIQRGVTAAQSVFEVLDAESEIDSGQTPLGKAKGKIEFKNLSFSYQGSDETALDGIDLTIEQGQVVAFVGQSGSGKTTLVSMLPRFYDASSGSIQLDGENIQDYSLADLRKQFSYVGQDLKLFDDTIRNNIAYGELAAMPDDAIKRAATSARAIDFIEAKPEGFNALVGESCLLYTSPSPRDATLSRMPSSA